jgi:hypothetical protein
MSDTTLPADRESLKSESAFVAFLNENLPGRERPLMPEDELTDALESLELAIVWVLMQDLGAELPPGIEATMTTVRDLYEHAQLRCRAEGLI